MTACSGASDGTDDGAADESALGPATVFAAASRSCSTSIVRGLTDQLREEIDCLVPHTLIGMGDVEAAGVTIGDDVLPYLQPPVSAALVQAAKLSTKPMKINSALRMLPQQYLLHRWAAGKRCGIAVAANVGESNHEQGLAVDIDTSQGSSANKIIRTAMSKASFEWFGPSDPVHFTYKGTDATDLSGLTVRAFKRLWTRNHPEAPLADDTTYDARVEARLKASPADGFEIGARCGE
jgi:hypothetical protein